MITRRFDIEKDYDDLTTWWEHHGHKIISKDSLSPVAYIYEEDGQKVCVAFMYIGMGTKMAQIGWATSNPESGLRARYRGFVSIVKNLLNLAEEFEIETITAATSSKGFGRILGKGLEQVVNHEFFIARRGVL